ncbi:peptidylprolyl isomerase [Pararhizobium sp. BT-229]|uniref:peptidylprolyl isomerase n=1 Tax=Pararhizobium sp. BT-229 TaxID=2986923 RepID=UPI0021F7E513|nr:peptidylprolyl isomerase [Pararhizobium sp. BT-229]MCV9966880.1 peptidylprolyl isomerase [Pararhizobium sp. BT-229]
MDVRLRASRTCSRICQDRSSDMSVLRKVFSEPLVQFLCLGVVVFGLYSVMHRSPPAEDKGVIEVGEGQLAQMFETFSKTWQRPPTEAELKGLIDGYVKEEVFYREGQKIGLDQNDTVFRRRMQQKMEFLLEPSAEQLTPKPGELEDYLKAHEDKYRRPPQLAFRQVFFKSDRPGDGGETAATAALKVLRGAPEADVTSLGDTTLLPIRVDLTDADVIATSFDEGFVKELSSAPAGQWFGPVRSQYGVHLVLVEESVKAGAPSLDGVKAAVRLDWESERRREIAERRYDEMKRQYEVRVLRPTDTVAPAVEISEAR